MNVRADVTFINVCRQSDEHDTYGGNCGLTTCFHHIVVLFYHPPCIQDELSQIEPIQST